MGPARRVPPIGPVSPGASRESCATVMRIGKNSRTAGTVDVAEMMFCRKEHAMPKPMLTRGIVLIYILGLSLLTWGTWGEAHRSGCHRWHSCPSDTGSYVCGDSGYCSQCPDNQYCQGGEPRSVLPPLPAPLPPPAPPPIPPPAPPPTCLPTPLPSSPRPPVFTMQAASFSGDQVSFDVWREPCQDNSGRIVPLLRATPLSEAPFVCSSMFTVIQAGIQYDIQLPNSSSPLSFGFCGDLFVPTTLLITQSSFGPQFEDTQAFQLIFQGDSIYTLNIAAAPPEPPSSWALSLNQTAFRPGDTLRVGLDARNSGSAFIADFYFAVLLPDGVTVIFVTNLSPLDGVVLPDFFVYPFGGGEAPGAYTVFALLTPPGAFTDGRVDPGDLPVMDARTFSFRP
jgi:hypothetical protein